MDECAVSSDVGVLVMHGSVPFVFVNAMDQFVCLVFLQDKLIVATGKTAAVVTHIGPLQFLPSSKAHGSTFEHVSQNQLLTRQQALSKLPESFTRLLGVDIVVATALIHTVVVMCKVICQH